MILNSSSLTTIPTNNVSNSNETANINENLTATTQNLFPYYCHICLTNFDFDDGECNPYNLSCGHVFCTDCLQRLLASKISDGEINPKCFAKVKKNARTALEPNLRRSPPIRVSFGSSRNLQLSFNQRGQNVYSYDHDENSSWSNVPGPFVTSGDDSMLPVNIRLSVGNTGGMPSVVLENDCNTVISEKDIFTILAGNEVLLDKYKRFAFFQTNVNGRECPNVQCRELILGDPLAPNITCIRCSTRFCYLHSVAHPTMTCVEYLHATQKETQVNNEYIALTSKPCPRCGKLITKSGGCNHMRCVCGAAFCWLCGKEIDDDTFPKHFQWWNAAGCSNLQMDQAIEPTQLSLCCARIITFFQILIFGPLSVVSSIVSIIVCPCVLPLMWNDCNSATIPNNEKNFCSKCWDLFTSCLTGWGAFYMTILVALPLALIVGTFGLAVSFLIYLGYACRRIYEKQYPWPDSLTIFCINCFRPRDRRLPLPENSRAATATARRRPARSRPRVAHTIPQRTQSATVHSSRTNSRNTAAINTTSNTSATTSTKRTTRRNTPLPIQTAATAQIVSAEEPEEQQLATIIGNDIENGESRLVSTMPDCHQLEETVSAARAPALSIPRSSISGYENAPNHGQEKYINNNDVCENFGLGGNHAALDSDCDNSKEDGVWEDVDSDESIKLDLESGLRVYESVAVAEPLQSKR